MKSFLGALKGKMMWWLWSLRFGLDGWMESPAGKKKEEAQLVVDHFSLATDL